MFPISDSLPTKRFPILNIGIIILTIYIFSQQITAPVPDSVILKYALIPSIVDFLQPFTLIPFVTAIFLHGGFLHIISNMWFLWIFGDNIEDHFGFFLFPVIYFTSGIVGNFIQYLLMPKSDIPMLGASGAIAGILGAYYILFPKSKIKTLLLVFFLPLIVEIAAPLMLGYWFILQLISGAASLPFTGSETGGIAFFAHIGGFFTGMIFARVFSAKKV